MTATPFGARLRELRELAGLSQEELAERACLSSHAVSALERGVRTRPYPHTIRSLADALGVSDEQRAALVAAVPARRGGAPAAGAADRRHRDLPAPATPLRGRDREVAGVAEALRHERLVTLTGIGGVGKTRVALAAAQAVRDRFADGVHFVELAPLLDSGSLLSTVADALVPGPAADADPLAATSDALRERQVLLVLDNMEHLLAAAPSVADLVLAAPGLTVLVTSRAPLRVRGEREWVVHPLALPDGDGGADRDDGEGTEDGDGSPAVRLLLERAASVAPGWGAGPGEVATVRALCTRLAGIPLALELAAARARLLDPAALLARLDDSLDAGARDLPARQRTMRATLDWSHGLLGEQERALLRLLSVFVGGVRLEDLESVAARLGREPALTVQHLGSLVEHSLVTRDPDASGRFRLLEPVAQYARERLEEAGEGPAAYLAHLEHYLALAQESAPRYQDAAQVQALSRIDAEHPNLSAAAERGLSLGHEERVGELVWALWMYWWMRGHHAHGRRLAEAVLGHDLPRDVRQGAALAAATMSFAMDDIATSRRWWLHAEELAGDEALAQANAVAGVGLADLAVGDLVAARERFERSVPLAEAGGAPGDWLAALTRIWTGTVVWLQGDPDAAVALVHEGLASARRRGDRLTVYIALYNLAQVELARGGLPAARRHLDEGMRLSIETGDLANLAYFLDAVAVLEAAESVHSRVPILLGAAQAIREQGGAHGYHYYRPDPAAVATAAAEARRHLGADRYDDAVDVGRRMLPAEAVDLAVRSSG